jgi:hypothetical protein
MNFINYKENLENREKKTEHTVNEKDETIFDLYILVIGYIIIICFGVWFHKQFYRIIPNETFILSIVFVIVFPSILYSYYIFHQIKNIREHKSYEALLEEAERELTKEEKISEIIPVILFGVAILYGDIQKNIKKQGLIKIVAPYLIFSLLFGTIVPNIVNYLIFDHQDLHSVFIASDFDFITISITFGLIITSLIMPFVILY